MPSRWPPQVALRPTSGGADGIRTRDVRRDKPTGTASSPTAPVLRPGSSPAPGVDMWGTRGPPFSTCSQSPEALTALQYFVMGLSKEPGVDLDRALNGGEGGIRTLWTGLAVHCLAGSSGAPAPATHHVARGTGIEPVSRVPKARVLPLNDPPSVVSRPPDRPRPVSGHNST